MPASVGGCYLGDERFAPFWAAAEATGAVVFVHPTTTGLGLPALTDHYLWNSVGNPLETAIAAAQLLTAGVLERHPGLTSPARAWRRRAAGTARTAAPGVRGPA